MVVLATFPSSPFFFPKLRIEQSFPFSCIGLVGMPLATPIFSWNHFDRKGMSLFWLNSIIESPCWLLWQLFFFSKCSPTIYTLWLTISIFRKCLLLKKYSFLPTCSSLVSLVPQDYSRIANSGSPAVFVNSFSWGQLPEPRHSFPIISTLLVLMP